MIFGDIKGYALLFLPSTTFEYNSIIDRLNAPADESEKIWDVRETFACGFQQFGGTIERPCPLDPNFPSLEDYEMIFEALSDQGIWHCLAVGKTEMAKSMRLSSGRGKSKDEALAEIVREYERYAQKSLQ